VSLEHRGGMFGLVFTDAGPVRSYEHVAGANVERFRKFFHGMLDAGIYMAPSAFEAGFVSAAHSDDDLDETIAAASRVFSGL
jgi:glutamate-1-semialdehyde 2,1-aminomutase